ncbi:MFS transporter [Kitasatospora arboriphila]
MLGFAARLLPHRKPTGKPSLDPVGAIGVPVSLALALVPLILGRIQGWPAWTWVSLVASVPAMALTLLWERGLARRGGQPLLNLSLFSDRAFSRGLVVSIATFAGFFSFMFTLTLVLQSGLGLKPLAAGFVFTPLGLAFSGASIASQRITAKYGSRMITTGGSIAAVGFVALLIVLGVSGDHTSPARLIGPMVLIGLGNGLAVPALVGSVLAGVRPQQAGAAAGVLTTAQQFASAAGVAAIGSVFFAALGTPKGVGSYATAFQWVGVIDLVLVLIAAAVSLALPRPARTAK